MLTTYKTKMNFSINNWVRVNPTCINCNEQHTISQGHRCTNGETFLLYRANESLQYDYIPDETLSSKILEDITRPSHVKRGITRWWNSSSVWAIEIHVCKDNIHTYSTRRFSSLVRIKEYLTTKWCEFASDNESDTSFWKDEDYNKYISVPALTILSEEKHAKIILETSTTIFNSRVKSVKIIIIREPIHD